MTGGLDQRYLRTDKEHDGHAMRPLYDARLEDLGPDDRVRVECVCGHVALLPVVGFIQGMRRAPYEVVVKLAPKMRCQCGRKGQVDVSIKWAD